MSKKDVVKPGHFKLAGRLRPGQDIVPEENKQEFGTEQAREEAEAEEVPLPGMRPRRTMAAGSASSAAGKAGGAENKTRGAAGKSGGAAQGRKRGRK